MVSHLRCKWPVGLFYSFSAMSFSQRTTYRNYLIIEFHGTLSILRVSNVLIIGEKFLILFRAEQKMFRLVSIQCDLKECV